MFSFKKSHPVNSLNNGLNKKSAIPEFLQNSTLENIYLHSPKKPRWMSRDYHKFVQEGYKNNVVAHRCISLISRAISSIPIYARDFAESNAIDESGNKVNKAKNDNNDNSNNGNNTSNSSNLNSNLKRNYISNKHANAKTTTADFYMFRAYQLIKRPNPFLAGKEMMEAIAAYLLIGGNIFIQVIKDADDFPQELHLLRPDEITILVNKAGFAIAYEKKLQNGKIKRFGIHPVTGASEILHIHNFNPENNLYGLSAFEPASYSIDQHNQAAKWNQSLLQNGARPSGALVVKQTDANPSQHLGEEQFSRLKSQIEQNFSGFNNSGKPLLLEGGLDWQEMSLKPSDMDFIEMKNTAAREIAMAFGIPAQMLGIPGDNTYSNMKEARLSMWEQTIIPLAEIILQRLNIWLNQLFVEARNSNISKDGGDNGGGVNNNSQIFELWYNYDEVLALSPRRGEFWDRINSASFLSDEEKKEILLNNNGKPRL